MTKPRIPRSLRVWLWITRALPYPIKLVSRVLHGRMGAAPERFGERLGQATRQVDGPVVWFHAASLGEVAQIAPLAERLSQSQQGHILVTTTTQAGADWVARALPGALHQFAPVDTPSAVSGFLDTWRITFAIFIEGDLWPRLILELQHREIPHALLNARHSRTRQRFASVFGVLLSEFSLITCRSDQVAEGIRSLGFPNNRLQVLPDLRIATAKLPCDSDLLNAVATKIAGRDVWLAASTHPGDEEAVLNAHKQVLAEAPNALLILAPRHPKRGAALTSGARAQGFTLARRSVGDAITQQTQIYLADTLGELGVFFSVAPIAFLGGSFGDEGGHNPYEPASFGTAILSGPKVKNFADAYADLSKASAAKLVDEPSDLGACVITLMRPGQAKSMGNAGLAFMEVRENSVSSTVALITDLLGKGDRVL
ncbi:MAG: 3-deoxy-D-manno-octulosonic acid transferase [Sedimentitalea sp.]